MKKQLVILSLVGLFLVGCNPTPKEEVTPTPEPLNYYTVTWVNEDGTTLEVDENVLEGSVPTYNGETPSKDDNNGKTYVFKGWTPELKKVLSDITYTATYDEVSKVYHIDFDLDGGNSSSYLGKRLVDDITLDYFFYDVKKDDVYFRGWAYNNIQILDEYGNLLVDELPSITDEMVFKAIYTDIPVDFDINPVVDVDTNTVRYGIYPQDLVTDQAVIDDLNEYDEYLIDSRNGLHLYKHEYYMRVVGNPYQILYHFSNGDEVRTGAVYWFKCSPIVWDIVSNVDNTLVVVSKYLLATRQFYHNLEERNNGKKVIYPSNYKESDIRAWLNNDFYNLAFNLDDKAIQVSAVDNSIETAHYDTEKNKEALKQYLCENTNDKIYIPSYYDMFNEASPYPYKEDSIRRGVLTDYNLATGGVPRYCDDGIISSEYMTRSPSYYEGKSYYVVDSLGSPNSLDRVDGRSGVRPVMTIKVN